MNKSKQIRTRFAPSPTGFLHLGGLRTALYNYLFAKKNKGVCFFRLEDTDQTRLVPEALKNLLSTLKWCGIEFDENPEISGPFTPYVQSQRLELYKKYADQLVAEGKAYYCFCTAERLEQLRTLQQKNKQPTKYDRKCTHLSKEEIEQKIQAGEKYVIRFKVPNDRIISVHDLVRGEVKFNTNEIDDQVLLKSDGFPTYHLAHAVDDHLMETTHVIRGEEWLPSTPKHLLLFEAFGWEAPLYAHLSLMLNPDKSKLSKRQGDVAVEDYQKKGYLPEALVNFVALCGWHPGAGSEQEIFDMAGLIEHFKLSEVQKAGAICDLQKSKWFNAQYLRQLPKEKLAKMVREHLPKEWQADTDEALLAKVKTVQERIELIGDAPEALKFYYEWQLPSPAILLHKKFCPEISEVKTILTKLKIFLENLEDWSEKNLEEHLLTWIADHEYKNGQVLWPYRVAITGQQNSPGPFEVSHALGKVEALSRLSHVLKSL